MAPRFYPSRRYNEILCLPADVIGDGYLEAEYTRLVILLILEVLFLSDHPSKVPAEHDQIWRKIL